MQLGFSIISEYISDIRSDIIGNPEIKISNVKLLGHAPDNSADTALAGRSDDIIHDGSDDILLYHHEDSYIRFYSSDLIEVFNKILDAFSFYRDWTYLMNGMTGAGCSLSEILDAAEKALHRPMLVIDAAQFMIAFSPSFLALNTSENWRMMLNMKSIEPEILQQFNQVYKNTFSLKKVFHLPGDFFPTPSCCINIFLNDELHATLIAVENVFFTNSEEMLFEEISKYVAFWIKDRVNTDTLYSATSYFAKALDRAPGAYEGMERRLSLLGWDEHCAKRIYVAEPATDSVHFNSYLNKLLTREFEHIQSVPYRDRIVILSRADDTEIKFEEELFRIFKHNNYRCAKSMIFTYISQAEAAYSHAVTALESEKDPCPGQVIDCEKYAMKYITNIADSNMPISLISPLPGLIKKYDQENNTEYYKTLFYFLKYERNHQLTAKALVIHRNTLFLRLQKIRDIWSPDLDNELLRFYLLYSFYHREFNPED